jgi:hypothetical protein
VWDVLTNASRVHAEILRQDVRYAVRSLLSARGYAATAVLVAALGIGATTTAFSVADHVLLRPLPFPAPDQLVQMWQDKSRDFSSRLEQSPANFVDWQRLSRSFSGMAAYTTRSTNLVGEGEPERLDIALVTPNLFAVLGTQAVHGRALSSVDDSSSAMRSGVRSSPPIPGCSDGC